MQAALQHALDSAVHTAMVDLRKRIQGFQPRSCQSGRSRTADGEDEIRGPAAAVHQGGRERFANQALMDKASQG
jgi:hypothetical protein